MNRFNKWLMRAGMLAAIALMTTPHTYGQSCLVFEREMETLFLNHQAKTPVPRQDLEQIRSRCPEPSRKMLLIYNFFRAVDAYQSPDLSDRESYDRAVAYYNRAAEHFMLLSDLDLKDPFFEAFYSRAAEFEQAIQDLSYQAGYGSRYSQPIAATSIRGSYSNTAANTRSAAPTYRSAAPTTTTASRVNVEWTRENTTLPERADINATRSNARMAGTQPQAWERSSQTGTSRGSSAGQRTTGNALPTQSGRSIESYAGVTYVGSLTEVDPMSYLRFSRSVQNPLNTSTSTSSANQRQGSTRGGTTTTPNPDELWRYTYTTTGSANSNTAINARTTQQSSIQTGTTWNNNVTVDQQRILVNVAIALPLTNRPGKSSPAIGQLGYGEAAYRVAGVAPSIQQGEQYVQVQTINGQVGWLPVSMLVEDGRLGVVIANVAGVANSGAPVSFFAAEPVVLARYENGRALIVGKDGKKAGWIANLNALSISEEDLHIADMIAEAMSHTSIYARRARLRDIQNHPTYYDSALKPVVDRLVVEEAQRN